MCKCDHLPRLLLCLALGAITTIAIAWSLALIPQPSLANRFAIVVDPADANPSANHILFASFHARGRARLEWAPLQAPAAPTDISSLLPRCASAAAEIDAPRDGLVCSTDPALLCRPHSWPAIAQPPATLTSAQGRSTDLRGFPFPALSSSVPIFAGFRTGLSPSIRGGITLRPPSSAMNHPWSALPLIPILPGFILDTLIWSLPWLAALTLLSTARASRRRRKNLCPRCAYSRAGLDLTAPCPECGRAPPPPTEPRP